MSVRGFRETAIVAVGVGLLALVFPALASAQDDEPTPSLPRIELLVADPLSLPGSVDSNSPALWILTNGRRRLKLFTSTAGTPSVSAGLRIRRMQAAAPVIIVDPLPRGSSSAVSPRASFGLSDPTSASVGR